MKSEGRSLPKATPGTWRNASGHGNSGRVRAEWLGQCEKRVTQCILSRLLVGALKTGKEPYPNILWKSREVELTSLAPLVSGDPKTNLQEPHR